MVNPDNIETSLAHQREINVDLLRPTQIVPVGVRVERTVRNAFNEKLFVAVQKELGRGANSRVWLRCHVERRRDISQYLTGFKSRDSSTSLGMTKEKFWERSNIVFRRNTGCFPLQGFEHVENYGPCVLQIF